MDPTDDVTRIGTQERERALAALGEHMRAGRLDPTEYSERAEAVAVARTPAGLAPSFADLPGPGPFAAPEPPAAPRTSLVKEPAGASALADDRDGRAPLFGRVGATAVAVSPFVALLLFFVTGYQWWWFLLIPLAGAVVYAGDHDDHGRDRRRDRDRRR